MEKVRPHALAQHCQRTSAHVYIAVARDGDAKDIYIRVIKKEFLELLKEMPNTKFLDVAVGFDRVTVKL